MRDPDYTDGRLKMNPWSITFFAVFLLIAFVAILMAVLPLYGVWSKTLSGKAELRGQEYERQVRVVQSKADLEAADNYANAEVRRAEGAAKAAEIISGSLNQNPAYLTYLAIEAQKENAMGTNHTTIYIPVGDNGIPLVGIASPDQKE